MRRAMSIVELRQRMDKLTSPEGDRRAAAFKPRPSDVIIATYPKSGTTWMQQIVFGLRTGGSMDFAEITEAVPWIELAHDLGHDLDADQGGPPRAFKSHKNGDDVQQGCRYIAVMRDPKDVAVSFFHFFSGWYFEPGDISLDLFIRDFFLSGSNSGRYWPHLISWWNRRADENTLFLCYEDMKADLPAAVHRVAGFLGIADQKGTIDIAIRQAGIGFMRDHGRQFDDHLIHDARDAASGLPPGTQTSKLGSSSERRTLTPALRMLLDDVWRDEIKTTLGYASYTDIRAALNVNSLATR
jgi:hypothetical protein